MKKLPLLIAITSLLTVPASFAVDGTSELTNSTDSPPVQIFSKAFDVSVHKESEIVVKPPVIDVIDLSAEKLEAVVESGADVAIGSVEIKATAKNCYAKIHTMNNFHLKGIEKGEILAAYGLHYNVNGLSGTSGTNVDLQAKFSSNDDFEQKVDCNTADLNMTPFKYNANAPVDVYNDVIMVEVRAES